MVHNLLPRLFHSYCYSFFSNIFITLLSTLSILMLRFIKFEKSTFLPAFLPSPHLPSSFLLQEITKREAASRQLSCIQLPVDSSVVRKIWHEHHKLCLIVFSPSISLSLCLSLCLCVVSSHIIATVLITIDVWL